VKSSHNKPYLSLRYGICSGRSQPAMRGRRTCSGSAAAGPACIAGTAGVALAAGAVPPAAAGAAAVAPGGSAAAPGNGLGAGGAVWMHSASAMSISLPEMTSSQLGGSGERAGARSISSTQAQAQHAQAAWLRVTQPA